MTAIIIAKIVPNAGEAPAKGEIGTKAGIYSVLSDSGHLLL